MKKEYNIIQMKKLNMKVIGLMVTEKEKENIFGKILNLIQDNLK